MTIRFLKPWNGFYEQQVVSLSAAEESRMISLGFATSDIDGLASGEADAKFARDANGNVIGLAVPDGNLLFPLRRRGNIGMRVFGGRTEFTDVHAKST